MTQLFRYFQDKESVLAEVANHIIDDVLESCRQQYGKGSPLLGNSLYLKDASGKPQLVEVMDPALESVLRTAPEIFGDEPTLLPLCLDQIYNMLLLRRARSWHKSNPSGFKGNLSNLFSLPTRHPHIIPPPTALVTVSEDDKRVCEYMFPLYKHGNLDLYARKKRERDQSFDQTLRTWYKQLVSAVSSLVESNTYHGDIKLDNILISDSNELILIDFTRSSTTMAIASPEVKEVIFHTGEVRIPPNWPIQRIEKSEVYSIGRTIFFISEGVSMSNIYHNKGPDNGKYPTKFHSHSSTPTWPQQIILDSVNEDALARPCLSELAMRLDLIDS